MSYNHYDCRDLHSISPAWIPDGNDIGHVHILCLQLEFKRSTQHLIRSQCERLIWLPRSSCQHQSASIMLRATGRENMPTVDRKYIIGRPWRRKRFNELIKRTVSGFIGGLVIGALLDYLWLQLSISGQWIVRIFTGEIVAFLLTSSIDRMVMGKIK